jgi:hypothetical protein
VAASRGKQIVVFLDYDGTLSPIVDDPDAAYMSDTVCTPTLSFPFPSPVSLLTGQRAYCTPDAAGGAQRGQALPHGDRHRAGPRQGNSQAIR